MTGSTVQRAVAGAGKTYWLVGQYLDLAVDADPPLDPNGVVVITFTEAAANGTPVLFQRREDWPEQDCLIDWLAGNVASREIAAELLQTGQLTEALSEVWRAPRLTPPLPAGAEQAAGMILKQFEDLAALSR